MDEDNEEYREDEDDDEEEEEEGGQHSTSQHGGDEYMGDDFDLESENFKEGYTTFFFLSKLTLTCPHSLEVLRKRKRWAQKEAEMRNSAREEERKKADLQDKGKNKGKSPSKVEQISLFSRGELVASGNKYDFLIYSAAQQQREF